MRKFLYILFVNNKLIDVISSKFLSIVAPPLVGLYYGTLDIWGSDWSWIKDYIQVHEYVFFALAIATLLILFIKGVSEQFRGSVQKKYTVILRSMLSFFNELVKKKRDRFYQRAKGIKPNADIFKNITHPKEQIDYALDGTKRLLHEAFNIDAKNVAITIIQGNVKADKWWYQYKCDAQKQHTKARDIMNNGSTAKYCYETGESIFIPDIRKGVKENVFFQSERSTKSKIGSIYSKPVRVSVNDVDFTYILTIVVYGQFMCTPYDEDECRACENLLDEISDRIELELYLQSMKDFKENGGKVA